VVRWGFPRRFGRFGWEPSQLSSGGVRVKVVVRGSFRGSSFLFSFSLSGLPAGRPAGRVGRGGHPESPLERADWGGSPGPKPRRWLRAGREPVTVVWGPRRGGGGLAAWGGGRFFPRGPFPAAGAGFPAQGHLRSFSAKRQDNKPRRFCVVCDTSPPRRVRVTRICRSPLSPRRRPRRAGAGFFSRRGLFRGRAARPRPPPGPFPGAAPAPPAAAPGAFRGPRRPPRRPRPGPPNFAALLWESPTRPVNFPTLLCRSPTAVVGFRTLLWRSPTGVVGFAALLCESPRGPLSRFALEKSDRRGRLLHFALKKSDRCGLLSHFALKKSHPQGGPPIPALR